MTGIDGANKQISYKGKAAVFVTLFVVVLVILFIVPNTFVRPPVWIQWKEKGEIASVSNIELYISLKDRRLSVFREVDKIKELLWSGDKDWQVSDFVVGDIDRDGDPEVLLLVWKRGSFGNHRPFWVERDTRRFTQHIFIYDLSASDGLKAIWMSSELEIPVLGWSLDERNLIHILDKDNNESVWGWMSWGLTRIDG